MTPNDPDSIAEDAIEDWTAYDLRCVVRPGPYCLNGYVRLPDAFVGKTQLLRAVRAAARLALDENVPITLGPWKENGVDYNPRWVGFFTGHFGMYWNPDDLVGLVTDEGMTVARTLQRISAPHDKDGSLLCTRERLRDWLEQVALAISSLRGPSEAEIAPNG